MGSSKVAVLDLSGTGAALLKNKIYPILGGLYLAQGIPTYLLLVALPPMMREGGASRTAIGLFSLLMLPLVLKFAVAPFVDRFALVPFLGHRRGWIIPAQLLVSLGIAVMAFVEPHQTGTLFVVACSSRCCHRCRTLQRMALRCAV